MSSTAVPPSLVDHDLFELLAEFLDLPVAEVRAASAQYGQANREAWAECSGESWSEKAKSFYGEASGYLLDVIHANQSKARLASIYQQFGHWQWIERSGPEVLEFGGGSGVACSLFRDLGRRVTYCDVDGPVSKFARWYFERTGQNDIEILLTPAERLELPRNRQWDFVFSDAVIEHLVDPAPTVDRLAQAVRPGGILYLIIDAHNVGPDFPMHQHVSIDDIIARAPALQSMRHVLHDGDGLNAFEARVEGHSNAR